MSTISAFSKMEEIVKATCKEELDKSHLKAYTQKLPPRSSSTAIINAITNAILQKIQANFEKDSLLRDSITKKEPFTPSSRLYAWEVYENVEKAISESPEFAAPEHFSIPLSPPSAVYRIIRTAIISLFGLVTKPIR